MMIRIILLVSKHNNNNDNIFMQIAVTRLKRFETILVRVVGKFCLRRSKIYRDIVFDKPRYTYTLHIILPI